MDEPEEPTFQRMPLPSDELQLNSDPQQERVSPQQQSFGDLDVTPEKEGMLKSHITKKTLLVSYYK